MLDRFLCNSEWLARFSEAKVSHLNREGSDHAPLLGGFGNAIGHKGCFKFQSMWLHYHDFMEVVRKCWDEPIEGNPFFVFAAKFSRLKSFSFVGIRRFLVGFLRGL